MSRSVSSPSVQFSPKPKTYPSNDMDMEIDFDFEIVSCDAAEDSYEEDTVDVAESFEKLSIPSVWSELPSSNEKESDNKINQDSAPNIDPADSRWLLVRFLEDLPIQVSPDFQPAIVEPNDPDFDDRNDLAVYCYDVNVKKDCFSKEFGEPMSSEPTWGCNPSGTDIPEQTKWPEDFKKAITFPFIFFQPKNRYNQH